MHDGCQCQPLSMFTRSSLEAAPLQMIGVRQVCVGCRWCQGPQAAHMWREVAQLTSQRLELGGVSFLIFFKASWRINSFHGVPIVMTRSYLRCGRGTKGHVGPAEWVSLASVSCMKKHLPEGILVSKGVSFVRTAFAVFIYILLVWSSIIWDVHGSALGLVLPCEDSTCFQFPLSYPGGISKHAAKSHLEPVWKSQCEKPCLFIFLVRLQLWY